MNLVKKFFGLLGFRFGLLPGERYACFYIPNLKEIADKSPDGTDWEWLDGKINHDVDGRMLVGRLDVSGEFCVTITDPELYIDEIIEVLKSRGYNAELRSIKKPE